MRFILLILSLSFFSVALKAQEFSEFPDTLHVRFLYGSKPKPEHKREQKRWFGGMLGGHVGVQYDSTRYLSFFYEGRVHVFQHRNRKSGRYDLQTDSAFNYIMDEKVDSVKSLSIYIPITRIQKEKFLSICHSYINETPYDYAFFGVRCGSSTYDVLSHVGVLKHYDYFKMWTKIFYPKKLRWRLIRAAKKNNWKMLKQKGTHKRFWEKDD
jgi:hypothetical protein|tara:strand:+ start:4765 stop:5397 length:633 start_codon:yes stop_codon:yes gene_type:complete